MADFFLGKKTIDQNTLDDLETSLLSADVGVEATSEIIGDLHAKLSRKALSNVDALQLALSEHMLEILRPCEQPLQIDTRKKPYVILVVGINGAGKTTSIGKLAHYFQQQGLSVMLAAGDTFRAAAVEQLQEWGSRNNVPVVAQAAGADPASVIFDAVQSAQSRNIDIIIADTAGRLHTQSNLMDELVKINRVMAKLDADAPVKLFALTKCTATGRTVSQGAGPHRPGCDQTRRHRQGWNPVCHCPQAWLADTFHRRG
jgi:fused signal recognition particle receptor